MITTCPLLPGFRVWLYIRCSPGEDQDVQSQLAFMQEYCLEHSLVVVHTFVDEARTGGTTAGRDAFEAMIAAADIFHIIPDPRNPRPVDGIVFWDYARFARDYSDSWFFVAGLRRRGYVVFSINDEIPEGDYGDLIEAFIFKRNEQRLKEISRDAQRGLRHIARMGYAPGGFPPRGYKAEQVQIGFKRKKRRGRPDEQVPHVVSRWIKDPEWQQPTRRAWEMRLAGATHFEVLEETKLYKSTGCLSTFYRNITYLGYRKCGDLLVPNAHEPYVTQEEWDAVQAMIRPRPRRGGKWPTATHDKRKRSPFLLSGLAECAYCDAAVNGSHDNVGGNRGKRGGQPWRYYICSRKKREGWHVCPGRKMSAKVVEGEVIGKVMARVLTPDFVVALVDEVNARLADTGSLDHQIRRVEKELREAERAVGNLLELAKVFGARSAGAELLKEEARRDRLGGELKALRDSKAQSRLEVSDGVLLAVLADMRGTLGGDDVRAKKALLQRLVEKVEIGNEKGKVWYTFPLEELTGFYSMPPREFESLPQP